MCIEIHNSHLAEIFYTVNTFREVITLAWSSIDHMVATDPNRKEPLTSHEKQMLEQGAKLAGAWGQSARDALDRDKNR